MAGASVQSHSPPPPAAAYHARAISSHPPPPPPPPPPPNPPLHYNDATSFLLSAFADGSSSHLLYRSGALRPAPLHPPPYLRFQDQISASNSALDPSGPLGDRSSKMAGAAKSRRAKKRQNKPPQRGLGVAQLEKIRLEEQRRASVAQQQQHLEASAVAAALHRFNSKLLQYVPADSAGPCVPVLATDSAAASDQQNLLRHSLSFVQELPNHSYGYDSDPCLAPSDGLFPHRPTPYLALSSPRRNQSPASPEEHGRCFSALLGSPFPAPRAFGALRPIQGRCASLNGVGTTTTASTNSPSSELDQQKMMELSSFQKLRRVAGGDMTNSKADSCEDTETAAGDSYSRRVVVKRLGVGEYCGAEMESAKSEGSEGCRKRWCNAEGSSSSRSSTTASSCTDDNNRMRTELTLKPPGDVEAASSGARRSSTVMSQHDINEPPPAALAPSLGFLSLCVAGCGTWTKGALGVPTSVSAVAVGTKKSGAGADHMCAALDEDGDGDDEDKLHHHNLSNKHHHLQQHGHEHQQHLATTPIIIIQGLQPPPPQSLLPSSPISTSCSSSSAALDLSLKL